MKMIMGIMRGLMNNSKGLKLKWFKVVGELEKDPFAISERHVIDQHISNKKLF